jgi:hypothetical protein
MEKTDHDLIVEMHTVLLGTNGNPGLCQSHSKLKEDFYKFRRTVFIVFAFLLGSGGIGFGIVELAKVLK